MKRRLGVWLPLSTLLSWNVAFATPFLPEDDAQVLERLPLVATPQGLRLKQERAELAADPHNVDLAIELARRYIQIGASNYDPRYYGYAEGILRPWLDAFEPPPTIVLLRATIRQHTHDFAGAMQDIDRVLQSEPHNMQAWLTRAVVLKIGGRYGEATESCARLVGLRDPLVRLTCLCEVQGLAGHGRDAFDLLSQAQGLAERSWISGERAEARDVWTLTVLAELAQRLGLTGEAESYFERAHASAPNDTYMLSAFADFLLDQSRYAEVETLLAGKTRIDPLLLRLALARHGQSSEAPTEMIDELAARFASVRQRAETPHQGEEARFTLYLLRRPQEALALALANWSTMREPRDARIVLEAALVAGNRDAAKPVLDFLANSHLESATLSNLTAQFQSAR
jgi:tetratricopeptide (TPR) repeat protein